MMQWRPLAAVGDAKLASTICFCLNHQQGLKRDENPTPRLILPKDIAGKTKKSIIEFMEIDVKCDYDTRN